MKNISALLFDKDGTLLDFYRTWIPINRKMALDVAGGDHFLGAEVLRGAGHDPDTDLVTPGTVLAGGGVESIAANFAETLKDRAPKNLIDIIAENFRNGGSKHAYLIEGALEQMRTLKALGYRLGIATNDTAEGLEASLKKFSGLLDVFEFRVGCDSGHGAKPGPGMGLAFASALELEPEDCAIIGDSIHDLEMGKSAGFGLRVGVLTGPAQRADLEPHADIVIESILELGKIFRGRNADIHAS